MTPHFEQGPIRPPSEARSLLVRVTRNCSWNKCAFCPVYKGSRTSPRPVEDVLADIDAMAAAADVMRGAGAKRGAADDLSRAVRRAFDSGAVPEEAYQVGLFLAEGGRSAFLQDADPTAAPPAKLEQVLRRLRERFPSLERITTYARAATLARRSPEALRGLAEAGLNRVHVGLESGSDAVLERIAKGGSSAEQIDAGRRVLGAGCELCFYVMPGLGGRELSADHVAGTARVIREVAAAAAPERPLVVRLRTTAVSPGTPLAEAEAAGRFELPDDVETARELRALLEAVGDARFDLRSDHSLNLLPELEGSWPADRDALLGILDRFLGLPAVERAEFALGRRAGAYWTLADRDDPRRRAAVARLARDEGLDTAEILLRVAAELRSRCV